VLRECGKGCGMLGRYNSYRFEGNSGSHTGFREDHGHTLACERFVGLIASFEASFHVFGSLEHGNELILGKVVNVQEMRVAISWGANCGAII
jgi:hypothetical protein